MSELHLGDAAPAVPTASKRQVAYRVHRSSVHGRGVFAQRDIQVSERIIEYRGKEITWEEALRRAAAQGGPQNHTFFFSLSNGNVIDGGDGGNASRWINHSCEPNCEAMEEDGRIYIYALCDICNGEELSYSYPLIYEGRHTAAIKRAFACRCGAPGCSGTMLAPKPRRRKAAVKADALPDLPVNTAPAADPEMPPELACTDG
jgi:SET domain-containing protein